MFGPVAWLLHDFSRALPTGDGGDRVRGFQMRQILHVGTAPSPVLDLARLLTTHATALVTGRAGRERRARGARAAWEVRVRRDGRSRGPHPSPGSLQLGRTYPLASPPVPALRPPLGFPRDPCVGRRCCPGRWAAQGSRMVLRLLAGWRNRSTQLRFRVGNQEPCVPGAQPGWRTWPMGMVDRHARCRLAAPVSFLMAARPMRSRS